MDKNRRKKTIRDIARIANTSPMTVSRVINKPGLVNEKTYKRVKKVIDKLNYKPNYIAQTLKGNKSKTIGFIVADFTSPIFAPIIRGIENTASKNDYSVLICESQSDPDIEKKYINSLAERMIDGIIINPVTEKIDYLKDLKDAGIKVVILGNIESADTGFSSVSNDEYEGLFKSVKYLIEKGHRKICYVDVDINLIARSYKLQAYKDCMKENKISLNEGMVVKADFSLMYKGYEIGEMIFKRKKNITAIACYNDLIAFGIIRYCNEKDIKIPDDISLIGYDDMFASNITNPPLTTVHIRKTTMGMKSAEILMKKITKNDERDFTIELEPYIVERGSVKEYTA